MDMAKLITMPDHNLNEPAGANDLPKLSYFPVFLDVAEFKSHAETDEKPGKYCGSYDAEELLKLAIQYGCSALQTLVLLLKNAFEGHCYLVFGIMSETLVHEGTLRIDPVHASHCELSLHFIEHLEDYTEGLQRIWQHLQDLTPDLQEICLDSMLYALLSSQLYRLPVSTLKDFDRCKFQNLTRKRKRFYQCYFEISMQASRAVAERVMIEHVNELYKERFRDSVQKLSVRQNLLFQVETKLLYANDPMIRTEEELEKKYFSFLIEKEIYEDSSKKQVKHSAWVDENEAGDHVSGLASNIRHLFRAISKNCQEAFAVAPDAFQSFNATRFFMVSNTIYNETNPEFIDQFIQYHRLINLFIEVYNARKINGLPVVFRDYTTIEQDTIWDHFNEETVQKLKIIIEQKISGFRERNHTAFKMKHVSDKELAEIHEIYLKKQILFLDKRIKDTLSDIKNVMKEKIIESSTQ